MAAARAKAPTGWAGMAARLVKDQGRLLFGLAYALTETEAEAERLLRAAMARTFENATKETPPATVALLARRALYAQFLDEAKHANGKTASKAKGAEKAPPAPPTPQPTLPLLVALGSLPAAERICVVMRFYEGLSAVTIARDIDVLPTTVRKYLTSALDTLAARLGDPGLKREDALYGGCSLEGEAGLPQQAPPSDAVTQAFTAVDDQAMAAYRHLRLSSDPTPVVDALTRRKKGRAWIAAGLSVAAVGSLALGTWTVARAVIPPAQAIAESPSPSLAPGPYGPGVLSSDNFLEGSDSWSASNPGSDGSQRFLSCAIQAPTPSPSASSTAGGITVSSDPGNTDDGHNFGDQTFTLTGGDCTQRVTSATSLSSTVTPVDASTGENHVSVAVTLKNTGDAPIAVYRDSISLGFELPWGALSSLQGAGQSQFSVQGTGLGDRAPTFFGVPMTDVVVLQPAEELTVVLSAERWRLSDLQALIDDPNSGVTQAMVEEWIRNSSAVGEVSNDDGILDAFRAQQFSPPGAVFVAVAPTEPDSQRMVILMDVHDEFGVMPTPSPSPSASATP